MGTSHNRLLYECPITVLDCEELCALVYITAAVKMCSVQCLKEAVDGCCEVYAVLKKCLMTTTRCRFTSVKLQCSDKAGAS